MIFFTIHARICHDDALLVPKPLFTHLVCRTLMQIGLISLAIIMTSVQLFSAAPVKSQTIDDVEVKLELRNESLLKAFQKIEKQSSFIFMYRKENIKDIRNLKIPESKKSISEFLKVILSNTALDYKQLDNRILITLIDEESGDKPLSSLDEKEKLLDGRQDLLVQGRVTDNLGSPLIGVSVMVKGSSGGTTTDADGNYSITVPNNEAVLVFTYIGFLRQEIGLGGRKTVNVVLQAEQQTLSEVVVTALGIERESKSLTYSTQNVNTEELTEAREVNIMNSLQGKVAGLSINSAGSGVGAEARVILRGNRSISGDSQPLYIVDGVPINGNPTDLSSDNIASIDVLKGPNAAALYGSAAQNGAIIISTKQGKAGEVNISVNHTSMLRQPVLLNQMQNVYGQGQGGIYDKNSEFSWGPKMDGQLVDNWSLDPADGGGQYALTPQPDNNIDAYQTGINTATNVLASIGGEKTQSVFSYTYTSAKGILPGNDLNRHNISLRMNNQLSKKLSLDSKLEYVRQQIDNGYYGNRYNPYRMIDRIPRSVSTAQLMDFEYTDELGHIRQNYFNPGSAIGGNPYWILNRTPNLHGRERVIAMTSLSYTISDAFKFMVRGSYDGANSSNEERLYNDNYASAPDGQFNVSKSNDLEFNADFLLSYTKDVAEDWNIGANVGGNIKKQRGTGVNSSTGVAMIIPNFFTIANTNFPTTSYNPGLDQDIQSLYAFTTVGWRNALFLDLTGRNDWSSTLPADNRSYFYPSVGLSAVLSELFTLPELFSFTKLRASWAQVGNSAPPYMLYRTASFSAGGNNGFLAVSNTLPNTNLRPEMTKSFEIGADIRFLKSRLNLDVTAYKTNTSNQLFTVALPVGSGASEFFTNGGDVENKGIEVLLSGIPIKTDQFTWNLNVNYAVNRNMVKRISDERPRLNLTPNGFFSNFIIEEGEPFGNIYSRGFLRDDQGRVIISDNGLPRITSGQTVLVGNFNPDWTGAVTNSFSYKNFSASFLIEHRQGGTVASETNAILFADGVTKQTLPGREGDLVFGKNIFQNETAVMADGSPNTTAITSELLWRSIGGRNTPVGEAFVDDATNTRLRELTIGYTFPKSIFTKTPISDIKLSLVGRNLFFIYRASENLDPDFMGGTGPTSEGTQSFTPATTRSFGLNLKVTF